jgi:hypothetical protein
MSANFPMICKLSPGVNARGAPYKYLFWMGGDGTQDIKGIASLYPGTQQQQDAAQWMMSMGAWRAQLGPDSGVSQPTRLDLAWPSQLNEWSERVPGLGSLEVDGCGFSLFGVFG